MLDLSGKTKKLFEEASKTNSSGNKEYSIISEFRNSSVKSEVDPVVPFFRIFTPVKTEKGRKLNPIYGFTFNAFKDTLMDYPTIIQHKLGKVGTKGWESYNRLLALHVAGCPLNCWHCYLEECFNQDCENCTVVSFCKSGRKELIKKAYLTAIQIVEGFIEQRDLDKKNGIESNVLRITGGEPFLTAGLQLEILEIFREKGLENDVFLWTETNLMPLIIEKGKDPLVSDELLKKLAAFKNYCVHPCFHGLSTENFKEVTGNNLADFSLVINAFKRLLDNGIDVYPTFGSNVSSPSEIEPFYDEISKLNTLLPLRFCLIEYDLNYSPVTWRVNNVDDFAKKHEMIFDRFQTLVAWNDLLKKNTGYGYCEIPRHLIPIKK